MLWKGYLGAVGVEGGMAGLLGAEDLHMEQESFSLVLKVVGDRVGGYGV